MGTVRSIGGWPIEYLVNGAHDHALSGNIHDALETLDSKYLKRIEVRITRNVNGQEILQVNIVTKGRLLGYRGIVSSTLSDAKWRNGAYLFTKRNNLGLSFSYYNTWLWDHDSKQKQEEWRYSNQDTYYTERKTKESGYKVDINNFELNLSYEIAPLKFFSVFGSAILKANPHIEKTIESHTENKAAAQTFRYKYGQTYEADRDAEYNVTVDYEQLFGENAERGKFYTGYNFYYRPVKTHTNGGYSLLEYVDLTYVKDLFDNQERTSRYEKWHTLNMLYRRKFNPHLFYVEEVMRYRNEEDMVLQEQIYNFNTDIGLYSKRDSSEYKHYQFANELKIGYGFTKDKVSINAGATHVFMHDSSREPLLKNSFSKQQQLIIPHTDLSYALNGRTSFRFSYVMGRNIPDIKALNPYVRKEVQGQITYGNPNLKAQTIHSISLSSNFRIGKFNFYVSSDHAFAKDLILQHSFLNADLLNITLSNIGKRYDNKTQATLSSKITPTTWIQLDTKLYYTDYAKNELYARNRGCTFSTNASVEQELPYGIDLSVSGGYNTPYIYMQGKGGESFNYNIGIYKSFGKRRITLSAEANSFIPVYYESERTHESANYFSRVRNRNFHASFQVSLRWRFGKLKAEERKTDERYEHEDIKTNYDE